MTTGTGPLELTRETVLDEWTDYNGHMNVAYYVLAFDHATDALQDLVGLDAAYRARANCSVFTLEGHVVYHAELRQGDPIAVDCRLLDHDAKRLHYFLTMRHGADGFLAASMEFIMAHVDLGTRKVVPMPPEITAALARISADQRSLPVPADVGRRIGIRRDKAG